MKAGLVGKIFIVFGTIYIVYALNMSVAIPGSGVVNLQMISDRQNSLIIAGLLFISGIILFSVGKMKQTEDEDKIDKLKGAEKREKSKQLFNSIKDRSKKLSSPAGNKFILKLINIFTSMSGSGKIIIGMACLAVLSGFMDWFSWRGDYDEIMYRIKIANGLEGWDLPGAGIRLVNIISYLFWIYPILMILKNKPINRRLGLTCSILIFSIAIVSAVEFCIRIDADAGGQFFPVHGFWIFLASSLGLIIGVVKYVPRNPNYRKEFLADDDFNSN